MTRKQLQKAAADYNRHEEAKRAERIIVKDYPWSHNPYIPHAPAEDCYAGCVQHQEGR